MRSTHDSRRFLLPRLGLIAATLVLLLTVAIVPAEDDAPDARAVTMPEKEGVDALLDDAAAMRNLVETQLGETMLDAVNDLLRLEQPRIIYYRRPAPDSDTIFAEALTQDQYGALTPADGEGYRPVELGEQFYYTTKYGTPIAAVRPYDLAAQYGFGSEVDAAGTTVVDFGFGSIGQLRLLASLGAHAHGIEVDPLLEAIYSWDGDTGQIALSEAASEDAEPGSIALHFGYFPTDEDLLAALPADGMVDLFISKNTLKRGYIHPEREVDPRLTIDLGVSDEEFLGHLHRMLRPGGLVVVYNLCPAQNPPEEPFLPMADGRFPFERKTTEAAGFDIALWNEDDTEFAHSMARAFGWDAQMDLENDLFGTVTILRARAAGTTPE